MNKHSQQRAIANFQNRLAEKGMVRFKMTGRDLDRELVSTIVHRLTEEGSDAERLRASVKVNVGGKSPKWINIIITATNNCVLVMDNERDFLGIEIINPSRGID